MLGREPQWFIILAEDVQQFTRMWFYANLTHPDLNRHLHLELSLRDPYSPAWEEKHVPKAMQRQLLLPFGEVKNLHGTSIGAGDLKPFPSLETELRALQATPPASPEHCLREAIRLKMEGNKELIAEHYDEALALYKQAWSAVHVIIKGRQRHIHADAFFNRRMSEEPFVGRNGQAERLLLRVQLVANTCQAYLKMGEYMECSFWGMRSIGMLREAMNPDENLNRLPEDEAILDFPGADQMGKIYYRTALAMKELGDESEARRLLRVAAVYLPRDEHVKKAMASVALKLG